MRNSSRHQQKKKKESEYRSLYFPDLDRSLASEDSYLKVDDSLECAEVMLSLLIKCNASLCW